MLKAFISAWSVQIYLLIYNLSAILKAMLHECQIFIKLDSESSGAMLEFVEENIDQINRRFALEFITIDKNTLRDPNICAIIADYQIDKLPSMIIGDEVIVGNHDICNILVEYAQDEGRRPALHDEEDVRNALIGFLDENGGTIQEDEDESSKQMEHIKSRMTTGIHDTGRLSKLLDRVKVRGESFRAISEERRKKSSGEYDDSMRGNRVTAGKGLRKRIKSAVVPNNNTQDVTTTTAYRGDESERTPAMGKPELRNPEGRRSKSATSSYLSREDHADEEADKGFDEFSGLSTKKSGGGIKASLRGGQRRSKSRIADV
jgi:hypothetical protein